MRYNAVGHLVVQNLAGPVHDSGFYAIYFLIIDFVLVFFAALLYKLVSISTVSLQKKPAKYFLISHRNTSPPMTVFLKTFYLSVKTRK